jgi:hypothetical protein
MGYSFEKYIIYRADAFFSRHDIAEILLKLALNVNQSIFVLFRPYLNNIHVIIIILFYFTATI